MLVEVDMRNILVLGAPHLTTANSKAGLQFQHKNMKTAQEIQYLNCSICNFRGVTSFIFVYTVLALLLCDPLQLVACHCLFFSADPGTSEDMMEWSCEIKIQ